MSKRLDKFLEVFLLMKMYDLLREEILVVVLRREGGLIPIMSIRLMLAGVCFFPSRWSGKKGRGAV